MQGGEQGAATVGLYEACGGADGLRRLVARFYDLMDTLPEAEAARAVHPEDLARSRESLFEYLSGWLGGPPLVVERRGPPMLRMRHLHAPIGDAEVEGWLTCFRQAWNETIDHPGASRIILPRVEALAWHMRNAGADGQPGGAVSERDHARGTRARARVRLLAMLSALAFAALLLTEPGSAMAWARLAGLALSVAILAVVVLSPGGRRRPPGDGA